MKPESASILKVRARRIRCERHFMASQKRRAPCGSSVQRGVVAGCDSGNAPTEVVPRFLRAVAHESAVHSAHRWQAVIQSLQRWLR